MAQRNPMNERYQGEGPKGQTRKSAAKLKPKSEAAFSVHVEKKPATKQERKAARKKRDAQLAAKEAERVRKAGERERAAKLAAGEELEEPKTGAGAKFKKLLGVPDKSAAPAPAPKTERPRVPNTPEYKKYQLIYRVLMGVGILAIVLSFLSTYLQMGPLGDYWMIFMGVAYVSVIAAIVIDYSKLKKIKKEFAMGIDGKSGKSPKQLKHEQQKAEAARLMEESKKAQKAQRGLKLPFARKAPDTLEAAAEEDAAEAAAEVAAEDATQEAAQEAPENAIQEAPESAANGAVASAAEGAPQDDDAQENTK